MMNRDVFFVEGTAAVKSEVLSEFQSGFGSVSSFSLKKLNKTSLRSSVAKAVEKTGVGKRVRNLAWRMAGDRVGEREEEVVPQVEEGRKEWVRSINDEIRAVAMERQDPMVRVESAPTAGSTARGGEADVDDALPSPAKKKIRFIFDSEDLLDACKRISATPNLGADKGVSYGLIKVRMDTPGLVEMREKFRELHPSNCQVGIDDTLEDSERFVSHRQALGLKVIEEEYIPIARQYCKYGVPTSLRGRIYRVAMGMTGGVGEKEKKYFNGLVGGISSLAYPIHDELFAMDCQTTIANDMSFFPFSEPLTSVVLAFSRDTWVSTMSKAQAHTPLEHVGGDGNTMNVPASGVHPFKGFVKYASPLALTYQYEEPIYFTFRSMYSNLWSKLNTISSREGELLHVAKTFEDLLFALNPSLFLHLLSIGVDPLQVAFPWIHLAFSNVLEAEQLLLLWDRLVGYDDLTILSLFAASIFLFRSEVLLCCGTKEDVNDVFKGNHGRRLKVVPLLQTILWVDVMQ